jgi:hypothetical protein
MKCPQDRHSSEGNKPWWIHKMYREESSVKNPKSGSRTTLRTGNPRVGSRTQSAHTRMQGT